MSQGRNRLGEQLSRLIHLPVGLPRLWPLDRHEPVQIGVGEPQDLAAGPALPARLPPRPLAHHQLGKPERQSLLSDTLRPGHQDDLGKPVVPHRIGQSSAGFGVADQGVIHGWKSNESAGVFKAFGPL